MADTHYDIHGKEVPADTPGALTLDELKAAWDAEEGRILEEFGGDREAADRAYGLDNFARKMQDQAETNHALREGTAARRVHDQIVRMDPDDRDTLYSPPDDDVEP